MKKYLSISFILSGLERSRHLRPPGIRVPLYLLTRLGVVSSTSTMNYLWREG
jgi:hypothetical protein